MLNRGAYLLLTERTIREDDGMWTAFCDELGLATCAESENAVSARLQKAVLAVLNAATLQGHLDQFLESRNLRIYPSSTSIHRWGNFVTSGTAISISGPSIVHRSYERAFVS
jgi:hypothetical protein